MDSNIKEELLRELTRFKEIGRNSNNLTEQNMAVNNSSGFLDAQGESDRLKDYVKRQKEMSEQEEAEIDLEDEMGTEELDIPLDPEAETEEDVIDTDIDTEVVDDEVGMDDAGMDEVSGDEKELDVTDLVTKQDEVNTELSDQKDILQKNTESLDDLMNKLSSLETHLTSMDDMVNKISNLEKKIEEYRPRTPEEKIGLRKYDSGPFNKTLTDFFTDKEEVFDETGKKQYILKKDDVENYSEDDIKKSFDPTPEEN